MEKSRRPHQLEEPSSSCGSEESSSTGDQPPPPPPPPRPRPAVSSQPTPQNPPPPAPAKSSLKPSSSSSDYESESDDDTPPPVVNSKVDSKAMHQAPSPSRTKKRTIENENNNNNNNNKRAKNRPTHTLSASVDDSNNNKKKHFQRVWSPEDEVTILEGLVNSTPITDRVKFNTSVYNNVKKDLQFPASRLQFSSKIRKLRKNYNKTPSGCLILTNPHQQKLFQLSEKVWGDASNKEEEEENDGNQQKFNGSPNRKSGKKVETTGKEVGDSSLLLSEMFLFDKCLGLNGLNGDVAKMGMELIGESKKAELKCLWKKLQVAELELYVKRAQLIQDQTTLILEAYKSSNH